MTPQHADVMPRAEQLDTVNKALLPVLRHFLDAFHAPETLGWRMGLATATGTWGEARGLAIANAVQAFVAAVLKCRPVPVRYQDPLDLHARRFLSADEIDLLALVSAMRRGRTDQARTLVERLTGGQVRSAVVRSGLTLANLLEPESDGKKPARTPALYIV